ncbi:WxL domain-containing protein [Shouchella sp. JSM 1781072]|uniref:WxL domain-containing protein n=1 Tax=Shouchella sp. JSM 1781072 TaxID=3344581 RepID=UPI0035BF0C17
MKKALLLVALAAVTMSLSSIAHAEEPNGATYDSNGKVKFTPYDGVTDPLDPENPDPENPVDPVDPTDPEGPNPGTTGPLSIDYASSLDFGENEISSQDRIYPAKAQQLRDGRYVPNYVQISDNRGTNTGWVLSVQQNGQFKNETTQHDTLTGAAITFSDPTVNGTLNNVDPPTATASFSLDPEGDSSIVMFADEGEGAGTWINHFGEVNQATNLTPAIELFVPGATPKDSTEYRTTLTWNLSDVPSND